MARKAEVGLAYFPMNTDIVHHPKVKLVIAEFGPRAWAVILPLFCKIYREKGYWIDWCDEDGKLLFAQDDCKCEVSFVDEVVAGCIRRGLFDKAVFDMFGVLTSDRIQGNYYEGKKRNKEVLFIEEFIVKSDDVAIPWDNVNILALNVDILTKNVCTGTQSRVDIEGEEERDKGAAAPSAALQPDRALKSEYKKLDKTKPAIVQFLRERKPLFIEPYVDVWNIFADERKKSRVKDLTDKRKKKFQVRIHEKNFDFLAILAKAKDSQFLMTGSFFSFDWLIENPENYLKVLEGNYENNKSPETVLPNGQQRPSVNDALKAAKQQLDRP